MYNPYSEEPRLNRFLLISLVLHVIMFFTLPNLDSFLESDVPGMAGGGIIQVMHVETAVVNPRPSPITNPASQSTIPRVTEPKPQPLVEPVEEAVAQQAEEAEKTIEEGELEHPQPVLPDPSVEAVVEEVPVELETPQEEVAGEIDSGVLTSAVGPEVVVETELETVIPPTEPRPQPETLRSESGSGQGSTGASDEAGTSQSGTGEADSAPPAPAPPPSGSSLYLGGGRPGYPKDAQHYGLEGIVVLAVEVAPSGQVKNVRLKQSSGHEALDAHAVFFIERENSFKPWEADYLVLVDVIFEKDGFVASAVPRDEVQLLNAP